jgi:hypothetical protein
MSALPALIRPPPVANVMALPPALSDAVPAVTLFEPFTDSWYLPARIVRAPLTSSVRTAATFSPVPSAATRLRLAPTSSVRAPVIFELAWLQRRP